MGVNENGFLSSDILGWVARHRAGNPEVFAIADELNVLAMKALHGVQPQSGNKPQLLVALYFIRALTHFQAAIVLAERGAIPSARAMVRVFSEAVFALGACANDERFYEELVNDDRFRRVALIRALLAVPWGETGIDERELRRLEKEADELVKGARASKQERLTAAAVARKAGLLDLYHLIYAPFSNAVHSSVRDLERHYVASHQGGPERIYFGPEPDPVADTVDAANQILFAAMHFILKTFPQSAVESSAQALWERQKARLRERADLASQQQQLKP